MAITTLQKYKDVKGIATTDKDNQITALIEVVEGFIQEYTHHNYTKDADTGEITYPKSFELVAINLIEYNMNANSAKQAESLGDYSVTYNTDYPPSLLRGLRKKARVF